MIAVAMGELRWSYQQVREAPISFFMRAIIQHQEEKGRKTKEIYEVVRMHATVILNSFSKNKISPNQVMSFAWDERQAEKAKKEQNQNDVYAKWLKEAGYDVSFSPDGTLRAKA